MPPDSTGGPLIGSAEAAAILGINKATLTRWVLKDIVTPVHKLPGPFGAYLFSRPQIMRLAQQRIARRAS